MKGYPILLLAMCLLASCRTVVPATSNLHLPASSGKAVSQFMEAETARLVGKPKDALRLYTDFVTAHPDNGAAHYNLARLQVQQMDLAGAEKHAARAVALQEDNSFYRIFYAQVLVLSKKSKAAEKQYDHLIKQQPRNEDYLYEKALLQMMTKNYNGAIQTFEQMEGLIGFNEELILQKKNLFQEMGKMDLAIAELTRLANEDKSTPRYLLMMVSVYESDNKADQAKVLYQQIEQQFQHDPLAQVALAQYYAEQKDTVKYNRYMQMVMKNKNLDVETKIALIAPSLSSFESDTMHRDQIIEMAASIAEESGDSQDAISLYADVLFVAKRYDEAMVQYRRYLQKDSSRLSVWTQMISIYLERQQLDSVLTTGRNALIRFPENALLYLYTGVSFVQKKQADSGVVYLKKGLSFEKGNIPLQAQLYASLGDAYNTLKAFADSDSCFSEAIRLQPDDATALNNYAYYLSLRKEKLEDAARMSKRSLDLQPNSTSFLDTYGWILFQQGKYKDAKEYIKRAIESDTANAESTLLEHMGDVYYKLGELDKALEYWNRALKRGEATPLLPKKIKDKRYYE
jgi:tetratricopeptide (TPR) repeat protein